MKMDSLTLEEQKSYTNENDGIYTLWNMKHIFLR